MTQINRDANGRFVPGGAGGPGRRPRQIEAEYLAKMESIVSGEAWESIVKKATADAIAGDPRARQWLSAYLLGMPISRVEQVEEEEDSITKFIRQVAEQMKEKEEEEETA
jgi:hypothetical protein